MRVSESNNLQYVFYVHSGITRNVALAYIRNKNIANNKITFITNRGYNHSELIEFNNFDISHIQIDISKPVHSILSEIVSLKDHLKVLFKNSFLLYAPSTSIFEVQTILNDKSCLGIHIIEEGNLAYSKAEFLTGRPFRTSQLSWFLWKVKCVIKSKFKLSGLPYVDIGHPKFKGVIGINNESFKGIDPITQIGLPFIKKEGIDDMNIIAFSNAINQNDIDIESFYLGLRKIIEFVSLKSDRIHYKWHPGFYKSPKLILQIKHIFLEYSDVHFMELTDRNSLEEIAVSSNSIFYSDYSSILIYASNAGREAYSNSRYLTGSWDTSAIWKRYNEGILEKIKFL